VTMHTTPVRRALWDYDLPRRVAELRLHGCTDRTGQLSTPDDLPTSGVGSIPLSSLEASRCRSRRRVVWTLLLSQRPGILGDALVDGPSKRDRLADELVKAHPL
jgi:hypothetical protein